MDPMCTVTFARRTRRGVVRREVREGYARAPAFRRRGERVDAAALAALAAAARSRGEACGFVVPDSNVVLHQLDVLEHAGLACPGLNRLIICQTVAAEVRARDRRAHRRLLALARDPGRVVLTLANECVAAAAPRRAAGESANDANDAAIRAACALVRDAGGDPVLATDDKGNLARARAMGLRAAPTLGLCALLDPALADFVRREEVDPGPAVYAAHLAPVDLARGVAAGTLRRGVFRAAAAFRGAVRCDDGDEFVVEGPAHVNRALDGDAVVVAAVLDPDGAPAGLDARTVPELKAALAERGLSASGLKAALRARLVHAAAADADDGCGIKPNCAEDVGGRRGQVVGVLARRAHELCGSFERSGRFRPLDRRFPRVIVEKRRPDVSKRVVVRIDAWERTSRLPRGHFVAKLGARGDKATETTCILRELGVAAGPFSARAMGCLPPADFDVGADARAARRENLRDWVVCSIDPPGCRDIDDALSCSFADGVYHVGVHIADVTRFVASGSPLDEEARARGTSTYLVDRRLDMLPVLLTADLCSLRAGVDRLAFSAFIDVAADGTVVGARYARSIIRSRAALTYGQAQAMLDADDGTDVSRSVNRLAALARVLRRNRQDNGALTLASPEVKFKLDREDQPTDVGAYELFEANRVVEEFMLLANVAVAGTLAAKFPALALLRRHPAPPLERFADFLAQAAGRGFALDASTSKRLAESLDAATSDTDAQLNTLLRIAATRCMAPAAYFCCKEFNGDARRHYGLAAPLYTHFTSPIRRYADVVVHRLLAAAIGDKPLPPQYAARDASTELGRLATDLNRLSTNAQRAGRRSVALHTLLFFQKRPLDRCEGRVLKVRDGRLDVLLPAFGVEASIRVDGSLVEEGALAWAVAGRSVAVRVFDAVQVRVAVAKADADADDAVVLSLVDPPPPSSEPAAKRARTA